MDNWLKIKIGNHDEVDSSTITDRLTFLELDSTPQIAHTYQTQAGINGSLYETSQYNQSTVNLKFLVRFGSWKDLQLARHDIYRFFLTKEQIRVRCSSTPNKVYYCRATPFELYPEKVGHHGIVFTVPLDNPSGMAYSIAPSDEIVNITENNEWSYGMNIPTGKVLQYHYVNENSFDIYNPSDIPVNPYLQDGKLTIQLKFSGSSCTIKNTTNNTEWTYKSSSNGQDTILLNGVSSSLNGQPCSKNTDYGHIKLEPGDNNIEVSGANSFDIVFSFPFVFLN